MARMRKLLLAMGGVFLIVGSMTVALTGATALAQTHRASASCGYPGPACGGLTTSSGSAPPGGTVTLSGHGYAPGATVTINICGLETITVTADGNGDFKTTITIPTNAVPGTTCVITATGKGASGQTLTTSTSILITSGSTVPTSPTGEPWASQFYWVLAGAAGLAGLGLIEFGRRRRFRTNT